MLPILRVGLESPTHAIVDKSLGCLPTVLSVLDFSTIKHELFPTVASVFSKTSSLGIKVRGLEAFVVLCGGSSEQRADDQDEFTGIAKQPSSNKPQGSSVLDKYTVQEKVVPLLKAMKTKEPAVMMAALAVFEQVGQIADAEFLAMETLPILWNFSLGPLLNLEQFQQYMATIKKLSSKIEAEQIRKLRDLSSNSNRSSEQPRANDLMFAASANGKGTNGSADVGDSDFERLVMGSQANDTGDMLGDPISDRRTAPSQTAVSDAPTFSWSTPRTTADVVQPQSRTITPDQSLHAFTTLSPTTATGARSQMQRTTAPGLSSFAPMQPTAQASPWQSTVPAQQHPPRQQSYSNMANHLPPSTVNSFSSFSLASPPSAGPPPAITLGGSAGQAPMNSMNGFNARANSNRSDARAPPKTGLDAYQSLL